MNIYHAIRLPVICLFALIYFTGCILTGPALKGDYIYLDEETVRNIDKDMAWVIGKLEVTAVSNSRIAGESVEKIDSTYMLLSKDNQHTNWLKAHYGKWFIWQLYPGEYAVSSIWLNKNTFIEPTPFSFVIHEPGKVYYLGNVDIKMNVEYIERDIKYDLRYSIASANVLNLHTEMIEYFKDKRSVNVNHVTDAIFNHQQDMSVKPRIVEYKDSKFKNSYNPHDFRVPPIMLRF